MDPKAYPLADDHLTDSMFKLINQSNNYKLVRRGVNEVIKMLERNQVELVVLAADVQPLGILLNLPPICEEKNVPYVFVKSKIALGRATGIARNVIAMCIVRSEENPLEKMLDRVKDDIEQLLI
eukprot:gb/GECH01008281.1/.p1 GENE.gb/GECH01008281.1/~~gb/GECH01008281.1/.p1  ORF type:complete len:124 (+),score=20.02 gb/GECH01008281.1/:1-372(+)